MSRLSFQPQGFASGLESIGSLDWDAEYEELVAADDSKRQMDPEIQEEPQDTMPAVITTVTPSMDEEAPIHSVVVDSTTVDAAPIARSPNWTCITDTPSSSDSEDLSEYSTPSTTEANNTSSSEDPFLGWEHPGWTWEESESWYTWTATSPEVCMWFNSPGIYDDAIWIVGASKLGDDYAHNDIPRVASILRRAYRETYSVPEKSGVVFPPLARGFKDFSRQDSKGPLETYRRGCKGLKSIGDPEIAVMVEWVPNGETEVSGTERPGPRNFFPQPSRLHQVWNAEEMVVTEIPAAIPAEIEELYSSDSSENEWADFDDSSEEEDSGRLLVDSFNTSMESVAASSPDYESCELFDEPSDTAPSIKLPSTPTNKLLSSPTIKLIAPPLDAEESAAQAPCTTTHTPELSVTIIQDSDSESETSFAEEGEEIHSDWEEEEDSYVSESEYSTDNGVETNITQPPSGDEEDEGSIASEDENINTNEDDATSLHISSTGPITTLHHPADNEDSESDECSTAASSDYPTSEEGDEEITPRPIAPNKPHIPAITLHTPTDDEDDSSNKEESLTTPTPSRICSTRLQELSPKLTGPGRSRTSSVFDTTPPPSPCLLSPALALRDAGVGRRFESARTLWQGYADEHGDGEGGADEEVSWRTRAAAAVAIVGGLVAFLG
ncbi:hypothetical protein GTA08_BOTSDO09390 [Neofusicoccum parvum]|uniref:Uncharacterized protein n=1 Tax=Neofusicoccum parvum TaxID=310453 RepID=A0ACB5S487_9PEZI|nr:hypothetical protein GTA08_BOTSDO09390 [Neofusicoccum parvum]